MGLLSNCFDVHKDYCIDTSAYYDDIKEMDYFKLDPSLGLSKIADNDDKEFLTETLKAIKKKIKVLELMFENAKRKENNYYYTTNNLSYEYITENGHKFVRITLQDGRVIEKPNIFEFYNSLNYGKILIGKTEILILLSRYNNLESFINHRLNIINSKNN